MTTAEPAARPAGASRTPSPVFTSRLADVTIPSGTLPGYVLRRAPALGGKPAIRDAGTGQTLSYAQLAAAVGSFAAGLAGRGFGRGSVLAIQPGGHRHSRRRGRAVRLGGDRAAEHRIFCTPGWPAAEPSMPVVADRGNLADNLGTVQHILALSRSAVIIRHWFEIDLDDSSMEHGARIEIRQLQAHPHRGTESASQLTTVDRPLWRADLFDRLADPPGTFRAAHYHPQFSGHEPSARHWDAALTADPWAWLDDQITSLGRAAGGAGWPLDPDDAAELPGLASAVVATAKQFAPAECHSASQCYQLTRDVQDAVQLMIASLRAPEHLDRDRTAPWLKLS